MSPGGKATLTTAGLLFSVGIAFAICSAYPKAFSVFGVLLTASALVAAIWQLCYDLWNI